MAIRILTLISQLLIGLHLWTAFPLAGFAQDRLAPGFSEFRPGGAVVIAPLSIELFEISAAGVNQPKAEWTALATGHVRDLIVKRFGSLGLSPVFMASAVADEHFEAMSLSVPIANAIARHQLRDQHSVLPTKAGKLDWSFGSSLEPLRKATRADYLLMVKLRDSYANSERKAAMVAFAVVGVGVAGGRQTGDAMLVDLHSGQVLWFNRLESSTGDLRDLESANASFDVLMQEFPAKSP